MWSIYDELIAAIPQDIVVKECLIGLRWTLVRSETVGMAMTPPGSDSTGRIAGRIAGMPLAQLAGYLKSWDPLQAALGQAAVNSFLNSPARVEILCGHSLKEEMSESGFSHYHEKVRGKKVCVVGHFPGVEAELGDICHLSILERQPQPGDFPDPASEYILPQQDYVFITATTFANKTLPRLLDLSRQASVVLVGPSAPLTPILFRYGIEMVAGTVTFQPEMVWQIVQEGGKRELFQQGAHRVNLTAQSSNKADRIPISIHSSK